MKKYFCSILMLLFATSIFGQKLRLVDHVNPFLGTAPLTDSAVIGYQPPKDWRVWAGLVFPGASVPNAMVQLSPVTEYHTGAGYQYEDSVIHGFTHTSKGHWSLHNIPLMPVTGTVTAHHFESTFSHAKEEAHPGYYRVFLERYGINVELTSTLRSGFHQYTFPKDKEKKLLVDLQKSNERVRDWTIHQESKNAFSGYQLTGDTLFFYVETNEEVERIDSLKQGKRIVPVAHFKESKNPLQVKIGLSYVSVQNAKLNLEQEVGKKSFSKIREEASNRWENLLSRIKIKGGTEKQKMLFYSSLYRSFLWPALRSDVNGDYRDVKGKVVNEGFRYYTIPSLWDTYRNKVILLGLLEPKVTTDVIKSMLDRGKKTGFIPTFFHGDHAAAFISGSYLRGIQNFDVEEAYRLLLNNATKEGGTRPYIEEYIQKGYISTPAIENPHVETKAKAGVAKTLEYAFDDYAVAQLANVLGDTANYRVFMQRSQNYKNVFDKKTRFMRGRLENGDWVKNFNPEYPYYEYMYREANGWQMSFFAPHDMPGLVDLYGGKKVFEAKLDSFYSVPWNPNYIARNVSCFIGQYCVGNQPDHEAPFSYYFVDKPEKSQKILDSIMNHFYGIGSDGLALPGMDDAGEMSSWYVFTAMGIYPFSSADDRFIVSVPLFDQIKVNAPDVSFLIEKGGESRRLKEVKVDKELLDSYFISQKELTRRGVLKIVTR